MYLYTFLLFFQALSSTFAKPLKKLYPIPLGSDRGLYNPGLHEGDILLVNRTRKPFFGKDLSSLGRNAVEDPDLLWLHAAIIYKTEDDIGCPESPQCEILMRAMNEYHEKTCIRFKEWTGEEDYVSIFFNPDSGSCWSPVGMVGDKQKLSLGRRCWYFGIVVHELGHAVGLWHEMNRPDRDDYIVIDWENIIKGFAPAFRKMRPEQVNLLDEQFDYKSVMMYDEYAFSKDGKSPTIQTTDGEPIGPLWMKNRLSDSDVRRLNKLYECENTNQKVSFPYNIHCAFQENVCGFKNGEYAIWKWKTDETNSYILDRLNDSGGTPGKLISPNLYPVSKEDKERGPSGCIRFWSILEGDGTMSLSLNLETLKNVTQLSFDDNATETVWFNKEVSQQWAHHQVTINITQPFRIIFQSQFYSDIKEGGLIAIDDLEILYNGPCHEIKRSIPKKPTTVSKDPTSTEFIEDLHKIIAVKT